MKRDHKNHLTILDLKLWLKNNYPYLYYSDNMSFADNDTPITQADFDDFKKQMSEFGSMDYKVIKVKRSEVDD